MKAGMQDYVTKPFNPDDFYIKLKKYLVLNYYSGYRCLALAVCKTPCSDKKMAQQTLTDCVRHCLLSQLSFTKSASDNIRMCLVN